MSNQDQDNNKPKDRPQQPQRGMRGRGPSAGLMPPEKPKDFKKTLGKLLAYLRPFIPQMVIAMIFAVAGTVMSILTPMVLAGAITEVSQGAARLLQGGAGIDFSIITSVIITLIILYIGNNGMSLVQGLLMAGVSQRVTYNLRKQFYAKINRMPLKYFDEKSYGDVLSRMTNDIDMMGDTLSQNIAQITTSIITIVGVIVIMLILSPAMTALALLIVPLSMLVMGIIIKFSQKFFRDQQKFLGSVNGQIEEVFSGHLVVKAFCAEEAAVEEFSKDNNTLYKSAW
ncbi:MAG: ABC transporter ATP-binding protein, partial [Defluviitaleaceae bacterium]|nr:ABC transporter ATP-binding protein [Defluviitaleaceae bacterium]